MNTNDPAARPPGMPPPAGPGQPHNPGPNAAFNSNLSPQAIPNSSLNAPGPSTQQELVPPNAAAAASASSPAQIDHTRKLLYNTTLTIVVGAPLVALLPPRKMDLFTFGLGVSWCFSAGYCLQEKTGRGLLWHIASRIPSEGNRQRAAEEEAAKMHAEAGKLAWEGERNGPEGMGLAGREGWRREVERKEAEQKERGFFKKLWLGDEPDDWVQERAKREKEALESGEGYSGLIMGQIREVFGGKSEEETEEEAYEQRKMEEAKRKIEDFKDEGKSQ